MFEPYEKIYNDCINRNLTIPKYQPVKECLYRIIDHYTNLGIFNKNALTKTIPASFTMQLMETIDLLIDNKADDGLDDVITFIFESGFYWVHLFSYLEAIQLKDKVPNKGDYYSSINDLIYTLKTIDEKKLDTNIRIERISKIFARHYQYQKGGEPLVKFAIICPILCANFYLTDLDTELLDELFVKAFLNGPLEYFHKFEEQFGSYPKPIIYDDKEIIKKMILEDINGINIEKIMIK